MRRLTAYLGNRPWIIAAALGLAVVAWMVTGDFVDWWDAFLWLVAFIFIEMNIFEWRAAEHAEAARDESKIPY